MFGKLFGRKGSSGSGSSDGTGGAGRPVIPSDPAALREMAMAHTQTLMSAHEGLWHISEAQTWDVDLKAPEIRWIFADGRIVRAPVQLIGTWNSVDNTFLWGWDHPSATPETGIAAAAVKAFADKHAIASLQSAKAACTFEEGWDLAAHAVLIGDLQGIYRGQASDTAWAYLGFGQITLSGG